MGKVVVIAMTSLDGYYQGPQGAGDLATAGVDDGFNAYNAEAASRAGAVVIGHNSFKDFSSYWPDREDADDASNAEKRFARIYNSLPKVVASRQPDSVQVPTKWRSNVRVVGEDLEGTVSDLKAGTDGDVVMWGSRNVWTQLLTAGLVDEVHVVAGTGLSHAGTPLFADHVAVDLTTLESTVVSGSKCVVTKYSVT